MKKFHFPRYSLLLLLLTAANLFILFVRNRIVGDNPYPSLVPNLFSGLCPLVIALLMIWFEKKLNKFWFWTGSLIWLLFYPNAPYMISDLIHEDTASNLPNLIDYDKLIIFSIAMLSVFYGFLSLKIIYRLFRRHYSRAFASSFITVSLALSCLGFYMGRVISSEIHAGNLYSWDVFRDPGQILEQVWSHLFPVGEHIYTYVMMLLFGLIQFLLLVMMKEVGDFKAEPAEVLSSNSKITT